MAFGSSQWIYDAASDTGEYDIPNSLRFNDDDSAYLSWTPSSAGNRKTWTFSAWVKRGNLDVAEEFIFTSYPSLGNGTQLCFNNNALQLVDFTSGVKYNLVTTQLFRDPSAWYHIVGAIDTTQSTSSDRVKLYVNGEQITTFSTAVYPTPNHLGVANNNLIHDIGRRNYSPAPGQLDGYLAEVNFIDGEALDQYDFGEFDETYGHWKAKKYTGSYGTNGFYLDFKSSSSLGNDASSNSNNWTLNTITDDDQMLDSPTNNFATLNPLAISTNGVLAEGNTRLEATAGSWNACLGTLGTNTGKWYSEISLPQSTAAPDIGFHKESYLNSDLTAFDYQTRPNSFCLALDGSGLNVKSYNDGTESQVASGGWTTGDVIGCAIDMDAKKIWFHKNGTYYDSGTTSPGATPTITYTYSGTLLPRTACYSSNYDSIVNFGQDSSFAGNKTAQGYKDDNNTGLGDFYYIPPAGYKALCTKNLPPIADGLWSGGDNQAFNTVLYTGNNANSSSNQTITGIGFQPDLVWTAERDSTSSHTLVDSVRGEDKILGSNVTTGETNYSGQDKYIYDLSSANNGSFSVGSNNRTNDNNNLMVAWNWKAGGDDVLNEVGTIASQVSANPNAGFSIVTYSGNNSSSATVGHGLGKEPEMIIVKSRTGSGAWDDWIIYHKDVGNAKYLRFDTNPELNGYSTTPWTDSDHSTTTFNVSFNAGAGINSSSNTYVAYCFDSVDGYSKVGSYTANSSTDGPFVYTGFKPAYVMCKAAGDDSGYTSWTIHDSARNPSNEITANALYADRNYAEGKRGNGSSHTTSPAIDFLSNGFKLRTSGSEVNSSNKDPYIYLAFAEHPFKYANAR